MSATTTPREPEVGQIWIDDGILMRITQVTDGTVNLEDVQDGAVPRYRRTIIPRSNWPIGFRYVGKP